VSRAPCDRRRPSPAHGRYLIFYRVSRGKIVVLRVLHGARNVLVLLRGDDT
jgi:plasmid stabilization system protein ParE